MRKLEGCKRSCILLMSAALMVIAAQAQTFTTLWNFDWADGAEPITLLVQGTDGSLYAPTILGGAGSTNNCCGTVFRITPQGALTRLHSFCSHHYCKAGNDPYAALVLGSDGNFYGGTIYGGANLAGTVFKISPTGTLTVVHTFDGTDGSSLAGLIQTSDGTFYGTTSYGGTGTGPGTVFKMTPDGTLTTLYDFGADGYSPGPMVQGSDGNFYGVTAYGGSYGVGTIFKVTTAGALTTLHNFNVSDGSSPSGQLIQAIDGNLYGTTPGGGANCTRQGGCGTIFKISPSGTLTTLYSFCAQPHCTDGTEPYAGLIQATDGNFYGTTILFGAYGYGTIFRMTPGGKITTLHSFDSTDGSTPYGGLVQATNGILYGTTRYGGTAVSGNGTVFSLDVGLRPFVSFVRASGNVGQTVPILGQGFRGTTGVSFNGTPASFTVVSDTFLKATVPAGATTGFVTATTPSGTLTSNVIFRVAQ
jgi:uncharacterized repeat protein (TIGR03803 family)